MVVILEAVHDTTDGIRDRDYRACGSGRGASAGNAPMALISPLRGQPRSVRRAQFSERGIECRLSDRRDDRAVHDDESARAVSVRYRALALRCVLSGRIVYISRVRLIPPGSGQCAAVLGSV